MAFSKWIMCEFAFYFIYIFMFSNIAWFFRRTTIRLFFPFFRLFFELFSSNSYPSNNKMISFLTQLFQKIKRTRRPQTSNEPILSLGINVLICLKIWKKPTFRMSLQTLCNIWADKKLHSKQGVSAASTQKYTYKKCAYCNINALKCM